MRIVVALLLIPLCFFLSNPFYFFGKFIIYNKQTFSLKKELLENKNKGPSLYSVGDKYGNLFLVSSDGVIKNKVASFSQKIHTNDFWDPSTCSRASFLVDGKKIFFSEVKENKDSELSRRVFYIYLFDLKDNSLYRYTLQSISTTGHLYKDARGLYVANISENFFFKKIIIYRFNSDAGLLVKDSVFIYFSNHYNVLLSKKNENSLIVTFTDKNFKKISFIYKNDSFKKIVFTEGISVTYEDNLYKVYNYSSSIFLKKQDLKNFDHVQVTDKNTGEILIDLQNDKSNKYIITNI